MALCIADLSAALEPVAPPAVSPADGLPGSAGSSMNRPRMTKQQGGGDTEEHPRSEEKVIQICEALGDVQNSWEPKLKHFTYAQRVSHGAAWCDIGGLPPSAAWQWPRFFSIASACSRRGRRSARAHQPRTGSKGGNHNGSVAEGEDRGTHKRPRVEWKHTERKHCCREEHARAKKHAPQRTTKHGNAIA